MSSSPLILRISLSNHHEMIQVKTIKESKHLLSSSISSTNDKNNQSRNKKKCVTKQKTKKNMQSIEPATNKCHQQRNSGNKKCDSVSKSKVKGNQSNMITSYFPIISRRILAAKLKEEEYNQKIIECIENETDPKNLSVTEFEEKGKAIIATASIRKGSFICEYSGDLIDLETAKKREQIYEHSKAGCYMYYFNWNSTLLCVDATKPTGRYGRLINHSRKSPNCKTKIFEHNHRPHLIFIALRDIEPNEEILYDYGERDPSVIKSNPWLTTT